MSLLQIIPNIFYTDLQVGIKFFVEGLGFKVAHHADALCIIKRDNTTLHLIQSAEFAENDRPEIRIATDDIEAYYNEIKSGSPKILHPNLKQIKAQPWGLKEFAMLDSTGVCIIVQQAV